MRITTKSNDKDFNLPRDFQATLTRTNIMLTNGGEQTAPITLPPTPNNLSLLGFSDRMDSVLKPMTDIAIYLSDGLMVRPANLSIHAIDPRQGISCTIYLGTSEFYSLVDERKIATLTWPVISMPGQSVWPGEDVQYLINLLKTYHADNNWVLAPVATSQTFKYRIRRVSSSGYVDNDIDSTFILNWFEQYQYNLDYSGSGEVLHSYQGEYLQKIIEGDNVLDITLGYGITPFLKIGYVLQEVFSQFGFTFDTRDIEDEVNEFANMFILNNVADAVYSGTLRYAQLLPDITIKDFIKEIEKWFCGKFIFDEIRKTVSFLYFKVLNRYTPTDISDYVAGETEFISADFIKKAVDINDSKKTETATSDTEYISLTHRTQARIEAEFNWSGVLNPRYAVYAFDMLVVDGIIHKNSSLLIDGKIVDKPDDSDTKVMLGYYNNNIINATIVNAPTNIGYRTSYPMFGVWLSAKTVLADLYADFISFYAYSNIAYKVPMAIPEVSLEKLNINTPKTFFGQIILIEKIERILGKTDKTQMLHFRTLRNYVDRS